jgi:hypothetical protein
MQHQFCVSTSSNFLDGSWIFCTKDLYHVSAKIVESSIVRSNVYREREKKKKRETTTCRCCLCLLHGSIRNKDIHCRHPTSHTSAGSRPLCISNEETLTVDWFRTIEACKCICVVTRKCLRCMCTYVFLILDTREWILTILPGSLCTCRTLLYRESHATSDHLRRIPTVVTMSIC